MPNDDKEKAAKAAAKQAIKDAKKDLRKGLNEAPNKGIYESTPMKNAAIDYIKGKEMYRENGLKRPDIKEYESQVEKRRMGGGLKGTEYNK